MSTDYIHKLNQLSKKRDMIKNKLHAIKRTVDKDYNPVLQFGGAYTQTVSITREHAPDLFDEVYDIVINYLQDELDKLEATLEKANNILKEGIADEI